MINIGHKAVHFTLKDQDGKEHDLRSLAGKKVVLSFHPLAWTRVCAEQMQSLEDSHDRFERLNSLPLGISVDSVPCKSAWAKELNITHTRLLSDFWPHGHVAELYGTFREKEGTSERANIVIDEEQKIIFAKVYPISQLPEIEEIIEALQR